jgi:hypothetical protein
MFSLQNTCVVIDPVLQSPDNSRSMEEITFKKTSSQKDDDNDSSEEVKNRSLSDYERISMSGASSNKENCPDTTSINVERRRPISCEISCQTDEFKGSPQTSSNYDHPINSTDSNNHKTSADTACKEFKKENKQYSIAAEPDVHTSTEEMKISFMNFSIGDVALFVPIDDKRQHWMAFHSNRPYRFLAQVHSLHS